MTNHNPVSEATTLAHLQSTPFTQDGVPNRVLIAPWGTVQSTNGTFVVDEQAAALTIDQFNRHATDLPIDYEHQTLGGAYAAPDGKAPAAGWIKRLFAEPGVGILAEIDWTQPARQLLASRQYRYLSPVAVVRAGDRRLIALHSAALTNKPAIVGAKPIINAQRPDPDSISDPAPDPDDVSAIIDPPDTHDPSQPPLPAHEILALRMAELRSLLALDPDTPAEQVILTARQRIGELRLAETRQRVNRRITRAVASGRLTEAQKDWAAALILRDETLFDEFLRTAPVLVTPGVTVPPGTAKPAPSGPAASHAAVAHRHVDSAAESSAAQSARAAIAREEYRANRFLRQITTEEDYVACALEHP